MAESDSDRKPPVPELVSDDDTAELMYVRCSVCGEWLDVKPGKLNWVSHGLCPDCYLKEMTRIQIFLEERRRQRGPSGHAAGEPPGAESAT